MQISAARTWLTLVILCSASMARAQSELVTSTVVPDAAACATLVTPAARVFPPALATAVQSTVQGDRLTATVGRTQNFRDRQALERLGQEMNTYLGRLLSRYGWPTDPALQKAFGGLLHDARLQFCAGKAALKAATT